MADPFRFQSLKNEARHGWSDMLEMVKLRRQLAEAEIRSDITSTRRLVLFGGIGLLVILIGMPVLIVAISLQLEKTWELEPYMCSIPLGAVLVFGGLFGVWYAWRRFRQEFLGLRQSLDELKEDLALLREWVEQPEEETDSE